MDVQDPRVRVLPQAYSTSVGGLKKMAFGAGQGEVLVEVDHDDLLTQDCLAELHAALLDQSVGFVYSNNAKLGPHKRYNPAHGWEYSTYPFRGQELPVPISFEPSAASLAFIWHAPDHVRAWRASVYHAVGGHDATQPVLDDHDLLIRTYLRSKMKHINKCLYIYRVDGSNTWLARNQAIQTGTVELWHKYAFQLTERWSNLNGLRKVDLGGAFGKPAGYDSIDQQDADILHNLEDGIPLKTGSVGVVRAHDILEHLHDKQKIMAEIYRVLADGGWLMVSVPSTDSRGAFQDPTHVSYWNQNSFWYWTRKKLAAYIRNIDVRFQEFRLDTTHPSRWHEDNKISYVTAWLCAIKSDSRRPHYREM